MCGPSQSFLSSSRRLRCRGVHDLARVPGWPTERKGGTGPTLAKALGRGESAPSGRRRHHAVCLDLVSLPLPGWSVGRLALIHSVRAKGTRRRQPRVQPTLGYPGDVVVHAAMDLSPAKGGRLNKENGWGQMGNGRGSGRDN
eukprot:scaffold5812_cov140-Isochrysis_galbana.AAC.2